MTIMNRTACFEDEVEVTLTPVSHPSHQLLVRCLFMDRQQPVIIVGRTTSKCGPDFKQAEDNAWIDCPVISRDHAEIKFNRDSKSMTIMDLDSLHGTFRNGTRIPAKEAHPLEHNDVLKFGVAITKNDVTFLPCTMKASIKLGTQQRNPAMPKRFTVPDSDGEDDFDDEDQSVRNSVKCMYGEGLRRGLLVPESPPRDSGVIDLTTTDAKKAVEHVSLIEEDGSKVGTDEDDCPSLLAAGEPRSSSTVPCSNFGTDEFPACLLDKDHDESMAASLANTSVASVDEASVASLGKKSVAFCGNTSTASLGDSLLDDTSVASVCNTSVASVGEASVASIGGSLLGDTSAGGAFAAEEMGAKFGKSEYFAARHHNKCTFESAKQHSDLDQMRMEMGQSVIRTELDAAPESAPSRYMDFCSGAQSNIGLLASSMSMELNDTSAYEFEMSKRARSQALLNPSSSQFEFCVEPTNRKRKIDDISELNDAEEKFENDAEEKFDKALNRVCEAVQSSFPEILNVSSTAAPKVPADFGQTRGLEATAGCAAPKVPADLGQTRGLEAPAGCEAPLHADTQVELTRPTKRLRKAMEVLGYAALGGVAVMSALIATAPEL